VLYNMCNIGAVMYWCSDCTGYYNAIRIILKTYASNRSFGSDWIGFSVACGWSVCDSWCSRYADLT